MSKLSEVLNSILVKEDDGAYDEKDYTPFVINRILSSHLDCVLYANEVNKNANVPKDIQYKFLAKYIRKMKRQYKPWVKNEVSETTQMIMEYFGYSINKAKEAERVLCDDDINRIKQYMEKGGLKKSDGKN